MTENNRDSVPTGFAGFVRQVCVAYMIFPASAAISAPMIVITATGVPTGNISGHLSFASLGPEWALQSN